MNVSVAYLIGRETRPPAERVRKLQTGEREREIGIGHEPMMSHGGIMSIQTAHLSISLYAWMCLCWCTKDSSHYSLSKIGEDTENERGERSSEKSVTSNNNNGSQLISDPHCCCIENGELSNKTRAANIQRGGRSALRQSFIALLLFPF